MSGYTSPPIRLEPRDGVIARTKCWRRDCAEEFRDYSTVLFTITGRVIAFCHRRVHDDLGYRAAVWADARREAA